MKHEYRMGGVTLKLSEYAIDFAERIANETLLSNPLWGSIHVMNIDATGEHPATDAVTSWCSVSDRLPENRMRVDVWVHVVGREIDTGRRIADCRWNGKYWLNGSKYITGRRYYDNYGDECLDPMLEDAGSVVVSHWVDVPQAPKILS